MMTVLLENINVTFIILPTLTHGTKFSQDICKNKT